MVEVWFFYILTAVIFWGINSLVDKIILTKYLNSFSYYVAFFPPKIIALAAILLFVPVNFNYFNSFFFYISFIAGVIAVIGYYVYALQ